MKRLLLFGGFFLALGIAVQLPAQPPDPNGNGDDPQVLAYGQLHEAYAQPTDAHVQTGMTAPKQPPEPVPEVPPEEKPEGDDVEWFPGYWSWDLEKEDFIWISGVWRDVPAGQQFVPGYWTEVEESWTRVPGFWTSTQQEQLVYTPEPPKSLDNGPNQPQPGAQHLWSQGYWYFATTGWFWHPGTWIELRPGLVWVAPHYCWSPTGYLLVGGYWDHPLEERGLVFAPVYFPRHHWVNTPTWFYYPRTVVSVAFVRQSFFVGPHRHYYFGNFYGQKWQNAGYTAWVNHAPKVRDPLYTYYHHHHPQTLTSMTVVHKERVAGTKAPPPKIINQQNFVINQVNKTTVINKNITNVNVKAPIQVVNLEGTQEPAKLTKVKLMSPEQAQKQAQGAKNFQSSVKNRKEVETKQAKLSATPSGQPDTKPVAVPLKEMKLPAAKPGKVAPKLETPPLPGVNTEPKPKPGVKPVLPEPKKPDMKDPKKPDPKDPKKPDPKDPKDPKKPAPKDPKKPDPKDPKKPDPKDPKKPDPKDPKDPKKPDPKDPKDPKKPDPKDPKPGKPPVVQPPPNPNPPVAPPPNPKPPTVQPPPAPPPNPPPAPPKPGVDPKPMPPTPPAPPPVKPEPPGKPPKKPPEEKKKKPNPPPGNLTLMPDSLRSFGTEWTALPYVRAALARRELATLALAPTSS